MSAQTLDDLLVSDIDDLTALAGRMQSDARHALLSAAAESARASTRYFAG